MKNLFNLWDKVALLGLGFYNIAMFSGALRFGREMGDIGYMSILFFGSLIVLVLYFLKYKKILKRHTSLITIIALGLLLFVFYYSSFGRGPDYPWDGAFWGT